MSGFFVPTANAAVSVTPATGATNISIDTTSAPGGTGAWTTLGSITGPVITELVLGDIGLGTHTLTLPAGWEFNTGQNVTIGTSGTTDFTLSTPVITPTATTISFTVTQISTTGTESLNFSNIQVRPTGTAVSTGSLTHSGAPIVGVVNGSTNFGTFSTVAGAPTQVRVETVANGAGSVVAAQSITADQQLTAYSITRDQFDNFVANAASTWFLINKTGGVVDGDLVPAGDNKSATLSGNVIGTAVINAVNGILLSVDSGMITVTPGAAFSLSITQQPASAGTVDMALSTPAIVLVRDSSNNNVVDGTNVIASKVSGTGTLFGTVDVTTVGGSATFSNLRYDKVDAFTIKFTSNGNNSATSDPVTLGVGALASIVISPNTATITADGTQAYTAGGFDQFLNTLGDVTGTTVFSIQLGANGGFVGPLYTAQTTGIWTVTGTNGSFTDTATLTVTPGALDHFTVTGITDPQTAGDLTSPVVTAYDVDNNIKTDYLGTITFSSDDVFPAALPSNYTFVGGDSGVHTFTNGVQLKTAGERSVTVDDGGKTGTQSNITVGPAGAANVNIVTEPAGVNSVDVALTTQPVVTVTDQYGNTVVNGVTVTASLASGTGVLRNITAVTAGGLGVATFSNLGYSKSDEAFTITFTAGTGSDTSVSVGPLTNGAPVEYIILNPTDGTVDAAIPVTVQLRDQYGNIVNTGAGKDTDVTLNADGSAMGDGLVSISNGVGVLNLSDMVSETVNLSLTDSQGTGLIVSSTQNVVFAHGVATKILITDPVDGTVDAPITVNLTVKDQHNNTVTTGGMAATSVTLNAPGSFSGAGVVTFTAGVGSTNLISQLAQTINLTLTDSAPNGLNVSSTQDVIFAPGVATHLTVTGISDPVVAGTPTSPIVTALDQFNNVATGYTGTVAFTSSDLGVFTVKPINYTFVGGDNGVHTFTNELTLTIAGEQTVTATDTVMGSINGAQSAITVTHAAINYLDLTASPSNLPVDTNSTLTITAKDVYGNTVLGDNTTRVHLSVDTGSLSAAGRTLTAGVASATVTRPTAGTSLVSVIDLTDTTILDDEVSITFTAIGAPVLSAINSTPSQTGSLINFTSDRVGKSRIDYGTTDSYGFSTQYPSANNMTADANNNITLGGLSCNTTYHYKVTAKSTSDVEAASADQTFTTTACAAAVIPTVVLNGAAIVSAYSVTEANARFATDVQFTITNDASVTVNGSTVAPVLGVLTAATNAEAKTLGAHVYHVVVTSSTGNTAEVTIGYQVNADAVVPVIPTISLVGASIVNTYVLADASTRFASGLQFNVTNDTLVTSNGATVVPAAGIATAATLAEATTLGAHTYHVVVTSSTGHTAEMTVAYQVNGDTDTTAPAVPAITTVSATTDANTYTIAGTVADDGGSRTITLYNGSDVAGSATIPTGDTMWAILVPLVQNAVNSFTATATDEAGNISGVSPAVVITEATTTGDTDVPAVPVITTIAATTDANVYTITGTAGADLPDDGIRTVTVSRNGTVVGSLALPLGETDWSFVSPLLQNTANSFTATSTDIAGNTSAASGAVVITEATAADTTAPVISSIHPTSIGQTTININWSTNEPSNTLVEYGLTSVYTNSASTSTLVTSHTKGLTGLAPGTTYHYRVRSTDASGNQATSDDYVFTTAISDTATLAVTGIYMVANASGSLGFATADNTFEHGWAWKFHVTVPTDETLFAMKFLDFVSGLNNIPATANIRFYSAQSSDAFNAGSAIIIAGANVYSANATLATDLESGTAGRQIEVMVEVRVPVTTVGGSYSTSYGVQSL